MPPLVPDEKACGGPGLRAAFKAESGAEKAVVVDGGRASRNERSRGGQPVDDDGGRSSCGARGDLDSGGTACSLGFAASAGKLISGRV